MQTETKTTSLEIGMVQTYYRSAKQSDDGPTVVFIHGWGSDHRVWSQQVSACRFATLTMDLPGFGRSAIPTRSLTVDDYADVVASVIEENQLEDVILVGHSFGGQITTALAAQQPEWLSGVVLVGSASLRETEPPFLSKVGEKLSPLFNLPLLRKLRPLVYKMIGADVPPENDAMRETMRKILRDDQRHLLSEITVPVQLIWGSQDKSTPLTEGELIAQKIPNSALTVLNGGHYIFLDQPTAFNDVLMSFVVRIK